VAAGIIGSGVATMEIKALAGRGLLTDSALNSKHVLLCTPGSVTLRLYTDCPDFRPQLRAQNTSRSSASPNVRKCLVYAESVSKQPQVLQC
jgi:hypothetical protein